ncbi:ArsR/SmtB family transcription factor [Kitasatospora sp. NPDC059673]|uniref:ArsR/SmtB family transcription factor n=1 Tax=Kitasatospora sp. NPDC059673 TaxID=3346901 RepID=UPI0036A19C4F
MTPATRPASTADGLHTLLGPARARALRAIAQGPSRTGELAVTLGIAPPSVSPHTDALRAAGLITTTRQGRHVQHAPTPFGRALVTVRPEREDARPIRRAATISPPGRGCREPTCPVG